MTVLAAGQHIADRYHLDRRIAVGGMGEVWEASDTRLGRSVAVKVLRPELSDDEEFLHRFRIEARTVASLDHSGIAAVHDYGEDLGAGGKRTAYLVMELVRGEPLSTTIARGPIQPDETLRLIEEAGVGVAGRARARLRAPRRQAGHAHLACSSGAATKPSSRNPNDLPKWCLPGWGVPPPPGRNETGNADNPGPRQGWFATGIESCRTSTGNVRRPRTLHNQ